MDKETITAIGNSLKGNRKQKGRRSAPKPEDRRITKLTGKRYSYIFKDPSLGELKVLATDNGWWGGTLGEVKLHKLIDAYKIDANDDEAIYYAGISHEQLQYFQELHPDFYRIKALAKQNLGLIAKREFSKQVEKGEQALTYLRLKRKNEGYNPRVEVVDETQRALYEKVTDDYKNLIEKLANGGIINEEIENNGEHLSE